MNPPRAIVLLAAASTFAGCTLHSTTTHWSGRVGHNGRPVFTKTSTNIGVNVGIVLPALGSTTLDDMVRVTTGAIADANGDRVRVVESTAENYWYGFPPVTWFLTPVVTTVTIEYEPDPTEIEQAVRGGTVQPPAVVPPGSGAGGSQP